MSDVQNKKNNCIDMAMLIILTLAVMGIVLKTPFSLLDDLSMIRDNPRYLPPTLNGFFQHFTDPKFHIFAPLTYCIWHIISIFMVIRDQHGEVVGMGVIGFKIASLLVHVLTVVSAWFLIRLFVQNRWAVLLGAMVFAIHPMNVESVAWTTGLKDELCGLFCFLSIITYHRYLSAAENRRIWFYWTLGFVICATLSKPTAVTLPLILLVVDYYVRQKSLDVRLASISPFIIPAVSSALVMVYIQTGSTINSPIWARVLVALDALSFYIYKIILPVRILPDYGRSPINIIYSGQIYWTWMLSFLMTILLVKYGSRQIRLASLLFILPLLPVLGLTRFDMQQYTTVTDHYIYQSLMAVGLMIAVLLEKYIKLAAVMVVILLGFAVLSVRQLQLWQNPNVLYEYNDRFYSRSLFVLRCLASHYLSKNEGIRAEALSRRAIEIEPRFGDYVNLASALILQERFDEAKVAALNALNIGSDDVFSIRLLFNQAVLLKDTEIDEKILRLWRNADPRNIQVQFHLDRVHKINTTMPSTTQNAQ